MKTLLRIDSSLRLDASYSREMGNCFAKEWQSLNPDGNIIKRDVTENFIPHLNQQTLSSFYNNSVQSALSELSDKLIEELYQSDDLLITAPMYNFGMPSSLKAYFDLIVRIEKTIRFGDKTVGLLQGKRAYVITTMGGKKETELSLVEMFLKQILNYIGISELYFFTIDGTADEGYAQKIVASQKNNIISILNN